MKRFFYLYFWFSEKKNDSSIDQKQVDNAADVAQYKTNWEKEEEGEKGTEWNRFVIEMLHM